MRLADFTWPKLPLAERREWALTPWRQEPRGRTVETAKRADRGTRTAYWKEHDTTTLIRTAGNPRAWAAAPHRRRCVPQEDRAPPRRSREPGEDGRGSLQLREGAA
jgi:hypothetical protein